MVWGGENPVHPHTPVPQERQLLRGAEERSLCERNVVGYGRLSSERELAALTGVYAALCPLLNYFMPSQKLLSKTRIGAKMKKVYD